MKVIKLIVSAILVMAAYMPLDRKKLLKPKELASTEMMPFRMPCGTPSDRL